MSSSLRSSFFIHDDANIVIDNTASDVNVVMLFMVVLNSQI